MAVKFEAQLVYRDEEATIAQLGPLAIYEYRVRMSLPHVRAGRELHRKLHRAYPAGAGALIWYRPSASLGPGEQSEQQRTEMLELVREANTYVKSAAVVLELSGFIAASVRAAATTITLLVRPRFTMKYVASLDEGVPWLVQQLGSPPAPSAPQVREALARLPSLSARP